MGERRLKWAMYKRTDKGNNTKLSIFYTVGQTKPSLTFIIIHNVSRSRAGESTLILLPLLFLILFLLLLFRLQVSSSRGLTLWRGVVMNLIQVMFLIDTLTWSCDVSVHVSNLIHIQEELVHFFAQKRGTEKRKC